MLLRVSLIAVISMLASGCMVWVEDKSDLERFVNKTRAKPAGKIEPLPEYKPYQSFVYEGASLREPYVPLQPMQAVGQLADTKRENKNDLKPDTVRPKAYLEEFSLDDLVMVGTITRRGKDKLWALIKDGERAVHRVSVGDHMGLDYGEVIAIDERKVELVEIVSNGRGGWMKRPRVVALEEHGTEAKKR